MLLKVDFFFRCCCLRRWIFAGGSVFGWFPPPPLQPEANGSRLWNLPSSLPQKNSKIGFKIQVLSIHLHETKNNAIVVKYSEHLRGTGAGTMGKWRIKKNK
jgi:hypothetical protein